MRCRATDKVHSYAKVIKEMNYKKAPDDRIQHVDWRHLDNGVEVDHAALQRLLRSNRSVQTLTSHQECFESDFTQRRIKKVHFANNQPRTLAEIAFAVSLFQSSCKMKTRSNPRSD